MADDTTKTTDQQPKATANVTETPTTKSDTKASEQSVEKSSETAKTTESNTDEAEKAELKKQLKDLQKQNKALLDEKEAERQKKQEEELSAKELLAKREAELKAERDRNLITEVRQELGLTHKIFQFAPMTVDDGEALSEKSVKTSLEKFKSTLEDYFEKHLKAVETPGRVTQLNQTKETPKAVQQDKKPAALKFGFLPETKVTG